jgi:NADPH:quinone reductase-like Zn-dependent oxidoreductase
MTDGEASTLSTAGVTAWNATAGRHELHSGDIVLVQGTGGVSTFACADYLHMLAFMKSHHLHPLIERVFPLDDYEAALQMMAAGQFTGKIVLTLM